jgi:hypothetical protein
MATGDPDDEMDEAAQIADFVRRAEADRLRNPPDPQPDDGDGARPTTWSGDSPLEGIAETFRSDGTPLLRTDFSDDRSWLRVVAEVSSPREFEGSPYGPYEPQVLAFDDRLFDGATGESLAAMWGTHDDVGGYVVLADARSMSEAARAEALTVVYVDLSIVFDDPELDDGSFPGRSFRCAVSECASIEANLAIANLDFSDYADHVGPDDVFRGFPEEG